MVQYINALPIGRRLEEYRIESVLGTGGFGVTYKAWDTHLETWVAIKEYFPIEWSFRDQDDGITVYPTAQGQKALADDTIPDYEWGLHRFLDEARVLARIKNPFVVRINRYFRANGTAYIVMDYEDGEPLSALLQRRVTLSESDILGLLQEVLPALEAVHEQGYLHRDLKPSNLYVRSRDGCVMLIDFGSARQALGRCSKSITGLVTPGYSPPEQYAIRSDRSGNWTDIYALGAVLYRCITGAPPLEAAERLIEDTMQPVQQWGIGRYNPKLLAVVDKALALRPDDRYQSVAEIKEDLDMPSISESLSIGGEPNSFIPSADGHAREVETELFLPTLSVGRARPPSSRRAIAAMAYLTLPVGALLWAPIGPDSIPNRAEEQAAQTTAPVVAPTTLADVSAPVVPVKQSAPHERAMVLLALESATKRLSAKILETDARADSLPSQSAEPVAEGERSRIDADTAQQDSTGNKSGGGEGEAAVTTAVEQSGEQLERLLRLADESIEADRLTIPYEQSALSYYEQILQLDPNNLFAQHGIERIMERYMELAEREFEKSNYASARQFITRGLAVDNNHGELLTMQKQLEALALLPPKFVTIPPSPQPVTPDPALALNPDSR